MYTIPFYLTIGSHSGLEFHGFYYDMDMLEDLGIAIDEDDDSGFHNPFPQLTMSRENSSSSTYLSATEKDNSDLVDNMDGFEKYVRDKRPKSLPQKGLHFRWPIAEAANRSNFSILTATTTSTGHSDPINSSPSPLSLLLHQHPFPQTHFDVVIDAKQLEEVDITQVSSAGPSTNHIVKTPSGNSYLSDDLGIENVSSALSMTPSSLGLNEQLHGLNKIELEYCGLKENPGKLT